MVSRTAVAIVALVALAAGVYSQNDGSTTGQFINKFVPLTVEIVSTGVANFVVTPATLVRPTVLATPNAEFNTSVLQFTRRQGLAFNAQVIEVFGTERASEDFVFNNQSLPFLQQVTKSGATYKFIQGVIYTPQETTPIPFVSPTGFLNADLSPFVAHIQTQNATLFVPNVAVRFDYSQVTAAGATQFVSLFYSDRPATTNPTVTSNLKQGYGVYINDMNQVFLGQTTSGSSGLGAQPTAASTPQNSGAPSTPITPSSGRKLFERLFKK